MPTDSDKPGAEAEAETTSEGVDPRSTTAAPASAHTRTTPAYGSARAQMPTLSDDERLEEARRRSERRPTPTGALSLANARVPSNLPPRERSTFANEAPTAVMRTDSLTAMNPVDREWAAIERASRPPDAPDAPADATESGVRVPEPEPPVTEHEMNDRVALGDYTGALAIAEKLLAGDAGNEAVEACADNCRAILRQMYTARIGPLDRVPVVMVPREQFRWLSIDHRAGFVLSLVDGVSSLEMILDVSGMPSLDALRILSELAQQKIIAFR